MISEHYPISPDSSGKIFHFQSKGPGGIFDKVVLFEPRPKQSHFNLALCVWHEGKWVDDYETNNKDFLKTMSTVAKTLQLFFEKHPKATVEIRAIERRRLKIYNGIFKRRHHEIIENYDVFGCEKESREIYRPGKNYFWFEIALKKA